MCSRKDAKVAKSMVSLCGGASANLAQETSEILFRRAGEEPASEGFEAQGGPGMHPDVRVAGL